MRKLREFLKRHTMEIMLSLTILLGCYFTISYILLKYILENNIHVAN